ncbi:MAG: hypothetical protein AAGD05_16855, partial [Bacteroidota bacterium]
INIDHDVVEIIEEFETNAKFRDIELEIIDRKIKGVNNQVVEIENALVNNVLQKNGSLASR